MPWISLASAPIEAWGSIRSSRFKSRFGCLVSFSGLGRPFFLVASFRHCKFKLSPPSVGAILQATIRGRASNFEVLELSDRVFLLFGLFELGWFSHRESTFF
jgi:hypothetical protein